MRNSKSEKFLEIENFHTGGNDKLNLVCTALNICLSCMYHNYNISYFAAQNAFLSPSNATCACPDGVLTFNCTVVEGLATVWSGTAFLCPGSDEKIILRHSEFFTQTVNGECGNAITATSTGHDNNAFMSQLNVRASSAINNKTIGCFFNTDSGEMPVNVTTLTVISGKHINYSPNINVSFSDPYL